MSSVKMIVNSAKPFIKWAGGVALTIIYKYSSNFGFSTLNPKTTFR
ncbi:MAG: hypothetical protein ACK4R9_04735 [Ignavibacterium sp.]